MRLINNKLYEQTYIMLIVDMRQASLQKERIINKLVYLSVYIPWSYVRQSPTGCNIVVIAVMLLCCGVVVCGDISILCNNVFCTYLCLCCSFDLFAMKLPEKYNTTE